MSRLRVVFMGTAPLACASLEALVKDAAFDVAAVVTQPDRPKGRTLKLQPSAVKEAALRLDRPVLQPEKARDPGFLEQLRQYAPDLIVVAAFGQILPKAILELPRFGCINVHTSLLPKYRGAAPIPWAIVNGEAETGVTIMQMDAGLDTGPILTQETTPIADEDNAVTLHDRLAHLGADLLRRTIPGFVSGIVTPRAQPAEGASQARKISKEDGLLDWAQPARTLWNRVRGLIPWPGAFTFLPSEAHPVLVKIWEAKPRAQSGGAPGEIVRAHKSELAVSCGEGSLQILSLQLEGGRRLGVQEFLAGHELRPGQRFTSSPEM